MYTVYVTSHSSTYIIHGSGREHWSAGRVQRFMERATWMSANGNDALKMSDGFLTVHVTGIDSALFTA